MTQTDKGKGPLTVPDAENDDPSTATRKPPDAGRRWALGSAGMDAPVESTSNTADNEGGRYPNCANGNVVCRPPLCKTSSNSVPAPGPMTHDAEEWVLAVTEQSNKSPETGLENRTVSAPGGPKFDPEMATTPPPCVGEVDVMENVGARAGASYTNMSKPGSAGADVAPATWTVTGTPLSGDVPAGVTTVNRV